MHRRMIGHTLVALVMLAQSAAAQPPLRQGTRVRVLATRGAIAPSHMATAEWVVGSVMVGVPPSLVLETAPGERVTLPFFEVQGIEVSRGTGDRKLLGAVLGGLVSGAAFTGAACGFSNGSCSIRGNVGGFLGYFAVGALPGALIGRAIGGRIRTERWESVWSRDVVVISRR